MSDESLNQSRLMEQATVLEALVPRVMRRLFAMDPSHPTMEMPLGQLRVCVMLTVGARSLSSIGEELGISVSAATQIADRMERAGLVERVSAREDRRIKHVMLTERGVEIMHARNRIRVRQAAEALAHIAPESRIHILEALQLLLEATENRETV